MKHRDFKALSKAVDELDRQYDRARTEKSRLRTVETLEEYNEAAESVNREVDIYKQMRSKFLEDVHSGQFDIKEP